MPSVPSDPSQCLIARGLNFGCRVDEDPSGDTDDFVMHIPETLGYERIVAIAKAFGEGCTPYAHVYADEGDFYGDRFEELKPEHFEFVEQDGIQREFLEDVYITLPTPISNAAKAFDEGLAFTEFRRPW